MSNQSEHSMVKVFFALWPTAAERGQLSAWQTPLKHLCGGRVMRGESLHVTLVFVGELDQSRLESLQLAAQEVSTEGFELCFDAARYWGHNHIAYAAPSQVPQQLAQLVSALEQSLLRHGFKFDSRAYKPHVTLLRNAHWSDTTLPDMPPVCWQARDFALVQSMPREYRVLARFPAKPSGG
jgi:2'-5' RNA ligase